MKQLLQALLFSAVLLLIAACGDEPTELAVGQPGQGDEPAEQVDAPNDDGDDRNGPYDSPDPASGDGYERTASRPDLVSTVPGAIDELVVDADGSTVLVRYTNAAEPCSGARVTTTETDTTVEVALETGLDPNAAAMTCIAGVFGYEIAVPLAAPVGTRELVVVQLDQLPANDDPFDGAVFPTDQYLGLTEIEAMQLGDVEQRVVRVARVDDEFFMLTEDYRPTRVNIEIEDGVVVAATSG